MVRPDFRMSAAVIMNCVELQYFPEALNFGGGERAHFARRDVQFQERDLYTLQFFHHMPEVAEHETNLILPALDQLHFVPGIGPYLDSFETGRRGLAAVNG